FGVARVVVSRRQNGADTLRGGCRTYHHLSVYRPETGSQRELASLPCSNSFPGSGFLRNICPPFAEDPDSLGFAVDVFLPTFPTRTIAVRRPLTAGGARPGRPGPAERGLAHTRSAQIKQQHCQVGRGDAADATRLPDAGGANPAQLLPGFGAQLRHRR